MGKHKSVALNDAPRITHEGLHRRHRDLVDLLAAEHGAGEHESVGNLADDLWEWITYDLELGYPCNWWLIGVAGGRVAARRGVSSG